MHINGALNTGCTVNEVKEIILQMSAYAGFPACINGVNTLKDVLEERKTLNICDKEGKMTDVDEDANRLQVGKQELSGIDRHAIEQLEHSYADFSPELMKFTIEYAYGDIFSRSNLSKKHRQIATIAALTALGRLPQLQFHINAGINVGLTKENIENIILLMSVYSGFPSAINGMNVLKDVIIVRKK
ncbi:MAG: carboxymuconolactone decarboxylase family protein [Mangrovibacterium sp.]